MFDFPWANILVVQELDQSECPKVQSAWSCLLAGLGVRMAVNCVTHRATVRIAKPAWTLPKLPLNLCNPRNPRWNLNSFQTVMAAVLCYFGAMPRAFRPTGRERGPERVPGVPIPASASLHSAWLLVENRVSEMTIKWTSGKKPRRNEWILAPFQKAASRWESSTEEREPLNCCLALPLFLKFHIWQPTPLLWVSVFLTVRWKECLFLQLEQIFEFSNIFFLKFKSNGGGKKLGVPRAHWVGPCWFLRSRSLASVISGLGRSWLPWWRPNEPLILSEASQQSPLKAQVCVWGRPGKART